MPDTVEWCEVRNYRTRRRRRHRPPVQGGTWGVRLCHDGRGGRADRIAWCRGVEAFQEHAKKVTEARGGESSSTTFGPTITILAHLKTFSKWVHRLRPFPLGDPMAKIKLAPLGTGLRRTGPDPVGEAEDARRGPTYGGVGGRSTTADARGGDSRSGRATGAEEPRMSTPWSRLDATASARNLD